MSFQKFLKQKLEERRGNLFLMGSGEDVEYDDSDAMIMPTGQKVKINARLREAEQTYYKTLAELNEAVFAALNKEIVPVTGVADSEKWIGGYNGALSMEEDAHFEIKYLYPVKETAYDREVYRPIKNSHLIINIYKMPSGSYELNSYLS